MDYCYLKAISTDDLQELIYNKYDVEIAPTQELVDWFDCCNGSYLAFDLKWLWNDESEKEFLKENYPERYLILEALANEFPEDEEILIGIFY